MLEMDRLKLRHITSKWKRDEITSRCRLFITPQMNFLVTRLCFSEEVNQNAVWYAGNFRDGHFGEVEHLVRNFMSLLN